MLPRLLVQIIGGLLFYLRKRSLGGFSCNLLSKGKALGTGCLKSYNAMTVSGSILLLSETNKILEVKDFRGLTFRIVKHNSLYIVTREPTEIILELV